jgi:tetratricopeptide (TPR) repeat protein
LKIHASQLRAWEQKGLIPRQDAYNLEECGRLRTLRDLSLRFSPATISASVGAMKVVAGMENPLLEAHPVASGARVLFRHRGSVTEPIARQFVFDFEQRLAADASSSSGQTVAIEINQASRDARVSEMFLEAVRFEDSTQIEPATQLYERILEINPEHAPTCINLGTICYNRRQFTRAEQLYRRATQADPDYALAFFDLGNVLDELKRLPEAIAAYRTAIRLVPTYADAHYNLALAYERTVERRQALRHWTAYLRLDANSRWAAHARKQMRKIIDREGLKIVHRSPRIAAPRSLRRSTPGLSTSLVTTAAIGPSVPTAG